MSNLFAISPPGAGEWIVILVIVVLLFGAKKLPELGSSVGRSIKNFKRGIDEGQEEDAADEPSSQDAPAKVSDSTPSEKS